MITSVETYEGLLDTFDKPQQMKIVDGDVHYSLFGTQLFSRKSELLLETYLVSTESTLGDVYMWRVACRLRK
ncbi:hypothetical protein [Vibrio phage XZ1]|uniref:Uncharacterized protein n=3 Tax=Schizotequatrovirus TaxID=1198137 RepID=A0A140B3M0_9CAUD|nr:hypothetical protein CF80_gp026 [Vibrio phage VH7D]YP_009201226.1 hypothetical protein AVU32_gp123 [Vibrio phage ValKK3]ALP47286.1 hypothetical protein phiGrn1_0249 [Vibrio phage phi-Grn1]ALP47670.1 hypothetical protein phiST2_0004 [Vibrio phage phi-ST2]QBX06334.1 hypothetical protein Va3_381 [Vibrio phage Va3]QNJ54577.1 hypothetical protein vBValMR10Z_36 [Vibrio phage vB_ValM_R10Z]QNJ54962.1 hypothetical protein vBValMR11Z_36 [Vibrio phage vB_ValM_R11Z]UOL51391.1 hypothetical protein [Vi